MGFFWLIGFFLYQRREVDDGHEKGRVFSLTSWYESDRVGRSGRRTDDRQTSVFSDLGENKNHSGVSFFQSPS